jgi:hypothetical protein
MREQINNVRIEKYIATTPLREHCENTEQQFVTIAVRCGGRKRAIEHCSDGGVVVVVVVVVVMVVLMEVLSIVATVVKVVVWC